MFNISLVSLNYFFNSFLPTILMFIFFLNGDLIQATQIGILSSFILVILNIFSSNRRNLILATSNRYLLNETLLFRIIFTIPVFCIYLFYLSLENNFNQISIALFFVIILLWINEILLSYYEIKVKKNFIFYNLLIFTIFLILLYFYGKHNFIYISFLFLICLIVPIVIYILNNISLNFKNILNKSIKSIVNNIYSITFISSFSFILSVFIWRFSLLKFLPQETAIYYFIIFALSSFPGTFINNYLGASLIKKKSNLFIKIYMIFIFCILLLLYILFSYHELLINLFYDKLLLDYNTLKNLFIYSVIGSSIMFLAMYLRVKIFFKKKTHRNKLFKYDFFYGIVISSIVPLLGFFSKEYLYLSYLIGSIFSLFLYTYLNKNISKL